MAAPCSPDFASLTQRTTREKTVNKAYKAWCRIYQTVFRLAMPILPYYEPKIMHSTDQVPQVLADKRIGSVLLVTDPGIARLGLTHGLEAALAAGGNRLHRLRKYRRQTPRSLTSRKPLPLYREHGCRAIIGFGGGSAMDCAKGVGARIAQPRKAHQQDARPFARASSLCRCSLPFPRRRERASEVTLAAVITDDKTPLQVPRQRLCAHPSLCCARPAPHLRIACLHYGPDGRGRSHPCGGGLHRAQYQRLYARGGKARRAPDS